jgi:PAS domain S-box-containing protein
MKPVKKKIKEQELGEKRFRALIENAHEGIVLYDVKGNIVFGSKSIKNICGFTEKEILGRSGLSFIHQNDHELTREAFVTLLKKPGKSITIIQRIKKKRGGYIWAESLLTNFSHIPEINGIVSNFRDISEKKIAEEKIFQTQELLQTITRNLSEGLYMGEIGSRLMYVNDGFLKLLGYKSFKEVEHIKPAEFYADQQQRAEVVDALRKHYFIENKETVFRMKNGGKLPVVINVRLLVNEGKPNYFVGTVRDITKDKAVELELVSSRSFLRNIVNTVAAPFFVKDSRHRWVMVNEKFQKLLGKTEDELLGKSDKHFLPTEEAKVFWETDSTVLKNGKTIVNLEKITSSSGEVLELMTVKSRYINERKEKFVIGFITDITQIKKSEEKIHQLNAALQGVLESTKESVYAVDRDYNYIMFNKNHRKVMKQLYNADIKVGSNKVHFLKGTNDFRWVKSELERAMKGNHFASEHFLDYPKFRGYIQTTYNPIYDQRKRVKGVAIFVNNITQRRSYEEIIRSVNANLSAVIENTSDRIISLDRSYRYILFNSAHAKGVKDNFGIDIRLGDNFVDMLPEYLQDSARKDINRALEGHQFVAEIDLKSGTSIEVTYNPIYDELRKVTGVAVFVRDISERKRVELMMKHLNEELIHQNNQLAMQEEELKATLEELSERNFELDQLMYKTSHDLRSPLSSIMGLVNLARIDQAGDNQVGYLNKIEDRIKKLDEFIRSMLNYARVNRVELSYEKVDLRDVIKGCLKELEYLENFHDVTTTIEAEDDNAVVVTDPLRINIILSNIISNAYKYTNPEQESYLKIEIHVQPELTTITFADNGIGIKSEYIDKICNMFFRATEKSQGSGLGMYIVQQALEKLQGSLKIESEHGKGTKIIIGLPKRKS